MNATAGTSSQRTQASVGRNARLDVTDGIARLRLGGVCGNCPSSIIAVVMGLEDLLRRHVPEVKYIEAAP